MPPTPQPTPSRMQLLRSLDPLEGLDYEVSGGGGPTPTFVPVTVPTGPDPATPPQGTPSLAVPPSGIALQVNPEEMGLLPGNSGPVIQREQIYPSPESISATFGPDVVEEVPVPLLENVKRNWILYLAIGVSIYVLLVGGKA